MKIFLFISSIATTIITDARITREMFYSGIKKPNLGTIFERPLPEHQLLQLQLQPGMYFPPSPPKIPQIIMDNTTEVQNITQKITPSAPADPTRAIRSRPTHRNSFQVELEAFLSVAIFYYTLYLFCITLYYFLHS